MNIIGKVCKLSLVFLLLQTPPSSAAEEKTEDSSHIRLIVATCYTCHSAPNAGIPELEGLTAAQLRELLMLYKTDQLQATVMNRISKALTEAEIDRVSAMLGAEAR